MHGSGVLATGRGGKEALDPAEQDSVRAGISDSFGMAARQVRNERKLTSQDDEPVGTTFTFTWGRARGKVGLNFELGLHNRLKCTILLDLFTSAFI